jgi:hypothetical protein
MFITIKLAQNYQLKIIFLSTRGHKAKLMK